MYKNDNTINEVYYNSKHTYKGFARAWDLVPGGFQKETKERIIKVCGWDSASTFYNKKKGRTNLSPLETLYIKEELARFNININGTYFPIKSSKNGNTKVQLPRFNGKRVADF